MSVGITRRYPHLLASAAVCQQRTNPAIHATKPAEAEPLFQKALRLAEDTAGVGKNHPHTAQILHNLAEMYCNLDEPRYDEAEPLIERSWVIRQKAYGREHPAVAGSLYALANLNRGKSLFDYAESLYKRALGIWGKTLGPTHHDTAWGHYGLGRLYHLMNHRYPEAARHYEIALEIRRASTAPDHPFLIEVSAHYAEVRERMGLADQESDQDPLSEAAWQMRGWKAWEDA